MCGTMFLGDKNDSCPVWKAKGASKPGYRRRYKCTEPIRVSRKGRAMAHFEVEWLYGACCALRQLVVRSLFGTGIAARAGGGAWFCSVNRGGYGMWCWDPRRASRHWRDVAARAAGQLSAGGRGAGARISARSIRGGARVIDRGIGVGGRGEILSVRPSSAPPF